MKEFKPELPFIIIILAIVGFLSVVEMVSADEVWVCETVTVKGKKFQGDCGYKDVKPLQDTSTLSCKEQLFTDHMGARHIHPVCKLPQYRVIVAENIG